jgi:hypothetical protein
MRIMYRELPLRSDGLPVGNQILELADYLPDPDLPAIFSFQGGLQRPQAFFLFGSDCV